MKLLRTLAPLSCCLLFSCLSSAQDDGAGEEEAGPMSAGTFAGLELRGLGPAFMSGRIADIAIHPGDQSTWYVAVGSGSVWKTTNAGTTWTPIFDDQGSYSIGCVTIDPGDPSTVWVGTGENVGGRHVGYGDGVYKSLDGGASWENVGLADSQHIGSIVVDPRDSEVVYVASQGPLWSAGGDRGVYKTVDGGATWERILSSGEYTGANEVILDPRDPDVLYAALHQRLRSVAALMDGGPESGIHKSTDGGATWRELESGLPDEDLGRIGLALSPQNPDVVYATIELADREGGFYRSADGGASWEKRSDYLSGGTGPHYYQEIFASPHAFDRIYQMDVLLHVSDDGGKSFRQAGETDKHTDNHALAFDADDPDYLLAGCDGGLYESWDLGQTWRFVNNLPVTQFYKVALGHERPFYNVYGGTQDNNTQGGPSRTENVQGIRNSDWFILLGGDGHQPATDPENEDIVYAEWQEGNLVRHDRKTGEIVYIQPQPRDGEAPERFNWDAPILVSPHAAGTLFFASQRVWRSDDRGDSWRPISPDLSRGVQRLTQPLMGRVWSIDSAWDIWAMSKFGTLTSLAQSPLDADLIYAGTDDGLIQVTEDGGASWRKIASLPGVPDNFFVNDLEADLFDADTVYVVVDDHKSGDFEPYLLRSTDRGRTWESMRGDLPERHVLWRIVQDHVQPRLFFLGTEFGLFFTVDGGARWIELTGGVPNISFRDVAIQRRENDLVGATFGRGFFVLDDYTPLRAVSEETLAQEAVLFAPRSAWWYIERTPLGGDERAYQGASFFVADNPPFGAVFTYYLGTGLQTAKEKRGEQEQEIAAEGGDTPTPGWDVLRAEERELEPSMLLTVRDAAGRIVRRVSGPADKGFHRVAWDLRRPLPFPPAEDDEGPLDDGGFLVAPGTYRVSLGQVVNGVFTDLGQEQAFEVVALRQGTLAGAAPAELAAFFERLEALQIDASATGDVLDATEEELGAARLAVLRSTAAETGLVGRLRQLELRLQDMRLKLSGDSRRDMLGDPGPVSVSRRLFVVRMGTARSTYGPTPTHLESMEIARRDLSALEAELEGVVTREWPELGAELDAAGVPWTPGRRLPGK